MAVTTTKTNKPLNPRGNDQSPKGYNRAELYSGKALDFDGVNDILTMPTALTSSLSTTTITHVVNFKTDFTTWSGARYEVFSYNERGVILSFNNGNIYVYYRHNASGWANFQIPVGDVKMQEWNHCVVVIDYDNVLGKAYINGQEVVSSALSQTSLAYDSNALTIGAQSTYRWFDGQITGFKIFNTALTAAQVADLYNNPEKIVPTGVADSALKLWLPMQEGAGTTAYDGSGNGNHGTISGATWTHGIGAPVAQTAVIDWNKGTNLAVYSEQFDNGAWTKNNLSISADDTTAPDGQDTADKITVSAAGSSIVYDSIPFATGDYMVSVYVKPGTSRYVYLRNQTDGVVRGTQWYDLQTATVGGSSGIVGDADIESANNGFYRISLECEPSGSGTEHFIVLGLTSSPTNAGASVVGEYVHAWGFQAIRKTTLGPYVRTGATAQTSDVLLPQGLTTGRDITGVNLFENVRKQGALNLDGNSRGLVHDNASLDYTSAATLEAWVYWTGEGDQGILGRWFGPNNQKSLMLYASDSDSVRVYYSNNGTASNNLEASQTLSSGNWYHFATTYDGSNIKIYVNAVQGNSASYSSNIYVSSKHVDIGTYQEDLSKAYNGQIAQPRIYNRALTAEEVERNYNAGKNIYK